MQQRHLLDTAQPSAPELWESSATEAKEEAAGWDLKEEPIPRTPERRRNQNQMEEQKVLTPALVLWGQT